MSKVLTVAILGAGSRGADSYGKLMNEYLSQQIGESEMYFSKNTLTNYLDHLMSINSLH